MPLNVALEDETAELLRTVLKLDSFYPQLSVEKLRQLFPKSGLYQFEIEEYVIKQGSVARNMYIVQNGGVRVFRTDGSRVVRLANLGPGEMFGEIALLKPDGIRTAHVITTAPSRIYHLVCDDVRRVMKASAALGEHLMSLARSRVAGQRLAFGTEDVPASAEH